MLLGILRGSPPYFERFKKDVFAMIRQLGKVTICRDPLQITNSPKKDDTDMCTGIVLNNQESQSTCQLADFACFNFIEIKSYE